MHVRGCAPHGGGAPGEGGGAGALPEPVAPAFFGGQQPGWFPPDYWQVEERRGGVRGGGLWWQLPRARRTALLCKWRGAEDAGVSRADGHTVQATEFQACPLEQGKPG